MSMHAYPYHIQRHKQRHTKPQIIKVKLLLPSLAWDILSCGIHQSVVNGSKWSSPGCLFDPLQVSKSLWDLISLYVKKGEGVNNNTYFLECCEDYIR